MRILIVTVSYIKDGKLEVEPETFNAITQLDPGEHFVDWLITNENKYDENRYRLNIRDNLNKARKIALDHGYDYMLIIESDIIPPRKTILHLVDACTDAATGLYPLRWLHSRTTEYCIFVWVPERNRVEYHRYRVPEIVNSPATIIPIAGSGYGCMMYSRQALQQFEFANDDMETANIIYKKGLQTVLVKSVRCKHKDEDGKIYG